MQFALLVGGMVGVGGWWDKKKKKKIDLGQSSDVSTYKSCMENLRDQNAAGCLDKKRGEKKKRKLHLIVQQLPEDSFCAT